MANDVTITKLIDGPRNAVFHIHIVSDGTSGDLVNYTIIDPAFDFSPELPAKPIITIEEIWYEFAGFTGKLQFNYLTKNTPIWTLSGQADGHKDFSKFGGLKDRTNPLDGNGKLTLTTSDFSSLGDQGTLVIKLRKD